MTTENNKIIAEFMGYIDNGCSEEGFLINPITNFDEEINDLRYHLDWNWLMEVVEKIFKDFYKINPCPIYLKINIEKALNEVNIEAVYNACVEFIKWYDEQKEV